MSDFSNKVHAYTDSSGMIYLNIYKKDFYEIAKDFDKNLIPENKDHLDIFYDLKENKFFVSFVGITLKLTSIVFVEGLYSPISCSNKPDSGSLSVATSVVVVLIVCTCEIIFFSMLLIEASKSLISNLMDLVQIKNNRITKTKVNIKIITLCFKTSFNFSFILPTLSLKSF